MYERIAEAYLESIDKYRGVYSGAYNLPQKRRWLARIGYEMQQRRSVGRHVENDEDDSHLLVEGGDVISWLKEEMQQGTESSRDMTAEEFLDYVGRRSGLFLPRSERRYAFVHLSFQEYFAAVSLEGEVTGINWARRKRTRLGLKRTTIHEYAKQSTWFETFAFLFELLAPKEDWHADVLNAVFGEGFSNLRTTTSSTSTMILTNLLTRLIVNQRSGLVQEKRLTAMTVATQTILQQQELQSREYLIDASKYKRSTPSLFEELLGDDPVSNREILQFISTQANETKARSLSFARTKVSTIDALTGLTALQSLDLSETPVADLGPVSELTNLERLNLRGTSVTNLEAIARLRTLKSLDLWETEVQDLGPLADLTALETLNLWDTKVKDLKPIDGLHKLEFLDVDGSEVTDLRPLSKLSSTSKLLIYVERL